MICEDALLLISGRIDKANTAGEEAELEAHLASCPACKKIWQEFSAMNMELQSLKAEVSEDFCDTVMEEVRKQARKRNSRPVWRVFAAAAALALVIGLGARTMPETENFSRKSVAVEESASVTAYADMARGMIDPAALAEEYGADVVVIKELLPELEYGQYEELTDGGKLYCLDDKDKAAELSSVHGLEFYSPENGAVSDVSYALLMP